MDEDLILIAADALVADLPTDINTLTCVTYPTGASTPTCTARWHP